MEALSTSVPSLRIPPLGAVSREPYHLIKPPLNQIPPHTHISNRAHWHLPVPSKLSSSSTTKSSKLHFLSQSQTPSLKPPFHRRAASGYAAALLDIARSQNAIEAVAKDARRFSKLMRNNDLRTLMLDPLIDVEKKGFVLTEVAEKGGFQKHLIILVKMIVEKGKVGLVHEVLEEFERIYDELCGTKVVMVSSAKKMEQEELFGMAKAIQKGSGAVRVKVRHFVDERLAQAGV